MNHETKVNEANALLNRLFNKEAGRQLSREEAETQYKFMIAYNDEDEVKEYFRGLRRSNRLPWGFRLDLDN